MIIPTLSHYLKEKKVHYKVRHHAAAFTAQEVASLAHVEGKMFSKIVMVMADHNLTMVVIPAPYNLDFTALADAMGFNSVELAFEQEFIDAFPGCDVGAMPPFGNLFNIDVWVSEHLCQQEFIYFNAGSFTDTLEMSYLDFHKLVRPHIFTGALTALGAPHKHEHARMGKLRH